MIADMIADMVDMTQAQMHAAWTERDLAANGRFFIAVRTTKIFCTLICPARPKPENVRLIARRETCLADGFRPCKRCKP